MIFNSFNFIVLFPLIFLLYYAIPAKYGKARNLFLLVVSYLLYLQWKPVYALILLGVTAVTYYTALRVEKSRQPKKIMTIGILVGLFPLAFFKYFNFINETISDALSVVGLNYHFTGLNWAIPIGISFFTFQALGYLWDVYYKRQGAEHDFLTYALFVSFFPSILSGPINKASLVIPQLKNLRPYFDYGKAVEGLKMLLWGMFMKVAVADRVALYVDTVLPHYENYTGTSCLVASLLYTVQIYADFAGYSLMALGVGKVLGFELTEEEKGELDRRLSILRSLTASGRLARQNKVAVKITRFVPCTDPESDSCGTGRGQYETVSGIVRRVDVYRRTIVVGEEKISLDAVTEIWGNPILEQDSGMC